MKLLTKNDVINTLVATLGVTIGVFLSTAIGFSAHYELIPVFAAGMLFSCIVINTKSTNQ